MYFAQVILPLSIKGTYTYAVPQAMSSAIRLGMRVLVPFGGKKIYTGIVYELHDQKSQHFIPKDIISILDESAILPQEQLRFWKWISDYYLCHLGEIYRLAFPSSLKLESETYVKLKTDAVIDFQNLDSHELFLIQALEVRQIINLSEIEAFIPKKEIVKTIRGLIDLRYIEIDEKVSEKYKTKEVAYVSINRDVFRVEELPKWLLVLKRSTKQQELFLSVLQKETEFPDRPIRKSDLFEGSSFAQPQLKALVNKGLLLEYYLAEDRLTSYQGDLEHIEPLSEAQKQASKAIDQAFREDKKVLLHGVTSSGKTHIYLEKIEKAIAENKNVLFLLPEIALTKQITQRLERKYGKQLGYYHPKLTDFEKVEVWRKIKNNDIKILIATRIALFLPFSNLGLIIVDEEHDVAYRPKDLSSFFFNARDSAMILADIYQAQLILGSATPSVESYWLAHQDKLRYVPLKQRFGGVDLPIFELINLKETQDTKTLKGNFSKRLIEKLQKNLNDHKQAMILHNRRGYANVIECESCGHVTFCSNCDVVMTYHKFTHELKCHYCSQHASVPNKCPKCSSNNLNTKGVGVEKIYEEVKELFPDAEVDRMDVDSMRRKFAYEKLYEKIQNGATDIVVGTQMISKGLDFDNIELVAVPRADQMLYVQDFRAEERAYQLIMQVSGRAGRSSGKGKVYIQTFNPSHIVFSMLKEQNHNKIYEYFLEERKKFHYPPFVKTILLELRHRKEEKVFRASQFMGALLRKYLPAPCVLGPEKAPIFRINTLYQYQILIKLPRGKSYSELKVGVVKSLLEFEEITGYQSIKKSIFVDF